MMNDVYDAGDDDWRDKRWTINLCTTAYSVARADGSAAAKDPLTQLDMNCTINSAYNLANIFITDIGDSGNCRFVFDNLGRPYDSGTGDPLTVNTTIELNASTRSAVITITKETGYVTLTSLN